jgi:hypothetical protein
MDINNFLTSDKNPLVSVARTKEMGRVQRGMGFVYKNISRRIKVIATCKHHFLHNKPEDFQFFLGGQKVALTPLTSALYSNNPAEDLAFFIVEGPRTTKNIEFNIGLENLKTTDGQRLYNVRCTYEPYVPAFPFQAMIQETFKVDMLYAVNFSNVTMSESVDPENIERQAELIENGFIIYPSIGMVSKVGCSGSPIFDDNLNLYGVNVRGAESTDQLIYVPLNNLKQVYDEVVAPELLKLVR